MSLRIDVLRLVHLLITPVQILPSIQRWRGMRDPLTASIQQPLLLLESTHQSVSTTTFFRVGTFLWLTDHLSPFPPWQIAETGTTRGRLL